MSLEYRIAEKLHAALRDLEAAGVSVLEVDRGLATGRGGRATIRLTVEDVAGIAARVAAEATDVPEEG